MMIIMTILRQLYWLIYVNLSLNIYINIKDFLVSDYLHHISISYYLDDQ